MNAEGGLLGIELLGGIGETLSPFLDFVDPTADARACNNGDKEACAWAAIGIFPFGKLGRFLSRMFDDIAGSAGRGKSFWGTWDDYPKISYGGRRYAVINGRVYTEHAINRMSPSNYRRAGAGSDYGRGVPPSYVDFVLQMPPGTTRRKTTGPKGERRWEYKNGTLTVITEEAPGLGADIVITVITKKEK